MHVRLFAGARAAAGVRETRLLVAPDGLVVDALAELERGFPGLARVLPACSFLLDGVAARREHRLGTATELDVLPPFSGG